jgi:hypothetical protein
MLWERVPEGPARRFVKERAERHVRELMQQVEGITQEEAAHEVLIRTIKELDDHKSGTRARKASDKKHADLMRRFETSCLLREIGLYRAQTGAKKDEAVKEVAKRHAISKRTLYVKLTPRTER